MDRDFTQLKHTIEDEVSDTDDRQKLAALNAIDALQSISDSASGTEKDLLFAIRQARTADDRLRHERKNNLAALNRWEVNDGKQRAELERLNALINSFDEEEDDG